jgi:hypothetical protein
MIVVRLTRHPRTVLPLELPLSWVHSHEGARHGVVMRKHSPPLKLAKRAKYWTYVLVSHSATIRTWPIAKNGSGSESIR